ncbi:MAG: dihydrofolate reductase family protein [Clostridium sp.]|nr:dihydrofolate reductase family protein [Clostridium sp.]
MRKAILYIAMSLDGYIADKEGGVGWLDEYGDVEENEGYTMFMKEIDTVIMGYTTYHQIATELSPDQWVYEGLESYVITHNTIPSIPTIKFIKEDPCKLVRELKEKEGKSIWICGGAKIVSQLMREDMIDTFYISVIPTILGNGIRLFDIMEDEVKLKLVRAGNYNGIAELIYNRR